MDAALSRYTNGCSTALEQAAFSNHLFSSLIRNNILPNQQLQGSLRVADIKEVNPANVQRMYPHTSEGIMAKLDLFF